MLRRRGHSVDTWLIFQKPPLLQHKRGCCRAEMLFDHHVDFGRTREGQSALKPLPAAIKAVWKIFNANGWENKIDFQ